MQTAPATAAAQKILAAYLSNHKLSPVAAAELAARLTGVLAALVEGRMSATTAVPRLSVPTRMPSVPVAVDDAVEDELDDDAFDDDSFEEGEMDEAEDAGEPVEMVPPEPAPRARRAKKVKASEVEAPASVAADLVEPEGVTSETPETEPAPARRRKTAKTKTSNEAVAEKPAKATRGRKKVVVEDAASEPATSEPVAAPEAIVPPVPVESKPEAPIVAKPKAVRRKVKAPVEEPALFNLAETMETGAPEPAEPEPAAPEPATPEPTTPEPVIPEPVATEAAAPVAPRPILRITRPPVVEDEDYDPYLGGPMPSSMAPAVVQPQNAAPEGGRKKRKRPPRPAHKRRGGQQDGLQSGATPANGGVVDSDDDYDPLI